VRSTLRDSNGNVGDGVGESWFYTFFYVIGCLSRFFARKSERSRNTRITYSSAAIVDRRGIETQSRGDFSIVVATCTCVYIYSNREGGGYCEVTCVVRLGWLHARLLINSAGIAHNGPGALFGTYITHARVYIYIYSRVLEHVYARALLDV